MEKARQYAQVDQLLAERNSLRSIARAMGVARNTIAKRVKKALRPAPALSRRLLKRGRQRQGEDLELDEMRTFVGREWRKVWLWLAGECASRRIVAWVLGSRDTATLRRLWVALPRRYHRHTRYFTDQWRAYGQVLPAGAHIVGKSDTRVVKALNGKLRHRCGVLVRRSCSFSKCRIRHEWRIKVAID